MNPYSFKTVKQFNKWKSKHPLLAKDSNNKMLYPYDYVKMILPTEVRTSWCSQIFWHPLSGAYVNSHPTHLAMNLDLTRSLSSVLSQTTYDGEFKGTVTKITYKEYVNWIEERRKLEEEWKQESEKEQGETE